MTYSKFLATARALACFFIAGLSHAAYALDISTFTTPIKLTDGQISIGDRTLSLPPGGDWHVKYTRKGQISTNDVPVGDTMGAYLIRLNEGKPALP